MDSDVIAKSPVKFLVAGMGDALGTYFEARACQRTDAPSLELVVLQDLQWHCANFAMRL